MIDYKKIIKTEEARFKILKMLEFIPDKLMLEIQYRIKCFRKLNLKNPERFSEKIQWYKLYYRNPLMNKCVDKYMVREYLEEKGYGQYLVKLYGCWKNVDEIDFNKLPNEFILKVTNGSGTNIIINNKNNINVEIIKRQLNVWLNRSHISPGREWAYNLSTPVIIAEELLKNEKGELPDYKFLCFNGKVVNVIYDYNRFNGHKRIIFDEDWNDTGVYADDAIYEVNVIKKPIHYDEMKKISEKLSEDFPMVRVDLYNIQGKIYFGELTFYPWSGYMNFSPDEFDYKLGEKLKLERY